MNIQQLQRTEEHLDIFDYYKQFGVAATCEKFSVSENDLMSMIVERYGSECNNILSNQIKPALRNAYR